MFHFAVSLLRHALIVFPLAISIVFITTIAHNVRHDTKEGQLLIVTQNAFLLWIMQLTSSVVAENIRENVRIAVKKIFLVFFVEEVILLVAAEKCVGAFGQSAQPGLEPTTAHIDNYLLIISVVLAL